MKRKSILFLFLLLVGCSTTSSLNSSISSSVSNSNGSNNTFSSVNTNNTSTSNSISSNSSSVSQNSSIISHDPYEGDYYKSIDSSKTGLALRSDLAKLITDTHKNYTTYDGLAKVYKTTDVDPNNPNNIIWFYTGESVKFSGFGGNVGTTNREHVWPKDSGKAFPAKSGPGSDAHHLRPLETQLNSTRGSKSFDEVPQIKSNIAKQNGSTNYKNLCYEAGGFFYPGVGYRGATARILMYMQTRWGNQYNLQFVDGAGSCKTIGKISTLMKWHLTEPVTNQEIRRNEEVYKIQGNRNPFIDHPEYASKIYCYDGKAYNAALKNVVNQYGDYSSNPDDSNKSELKAITLSKTNIDMTIGQTNKIEVIPNPSDALYDVEWSSDNNEIATVDNGVITAHNNGECNISATSKDNKNIKATVKVFVKSVKNIVISGNLEKSIYQEGDKFDSKGLIVTATYTDDSTKIISNFDCLWLDRNTKEETLSVGTTGVICKFGNLEEIYEGIVVNQENEKIYKLVNDNTSLNNNDKVILVNEKFNVVASSMEKDYLSKSNVNIENNSIKELPKEALVFTLKITNNVYNLENNGKLLGSSSKKNMVWDSYSDWQIEIDKGNATIKNSAGIILYNSSAPRFTTYGFANASIVLPQIYKLS